MEEMATGGMDATQPDQTAQSSVSQGIPQKLKLKIDGVDDEVDLEVLKRDYQKYKSSDKRLQEASELRKQALEERKRAQEESQLVAHFLQQAQSGDLSWLKGIVSDDQIRQFAEAELLEQLEWESKSDIEREAISAKREAEQLRREIEEMTQTKEREHATQIEEQAYQEIEQDIVQAIETLGYDYKATPRFIRRIAEQMQASLMASDDPSAKPLPAKQAAQMAFQGLQTDAQELIKILPTEQVIQLLPAEVRKALRRMDLEGVYSQTPGRQARQQMPSEGRRSKKPTAMTTDEYFAKKIESKFR